LNRVVTTFQKEKQNWKQFRKRKPSGSANFFLEAEAEALRVEAEALKIQALSHHCPKVSPGPAMPYLVVGPSLKWPYAVSGVACPHDGRPAAVFYPLEHPTLYASAHGP
jgi:hypothetical protein